MCSAKKLRFKRVTRFDAFRILNLLILHWLKASHTAELHHS